MATTVTPYLIFLLLTATTGPLLFGYHLAELNAPSEVITCARNSLSQVPTDEAADAFSNAKISGVLSEEALPRCIPMNAPQFGLVTSMFTLGGLIGALAAGPITARSGRVRGMLYSALFATVGPAFEAVAMNVGVMAFGRFVAGLGAGGAMVIVPIYIFDIAPPGRKGFFGSFTQVMVNMGILTTQVLGYFLSTERYQLWRVILAVGGAVGLAQAVFLVVGGRESPKYLADQGHPAQAKKVLQKIRGRGADIDAEVTAWGQGGRDLDEEQETLLANEESAHDNSPERGSSTRSRKDTPVTKQETLGAFQVLRNPDTRRAVFAIVMIMLAQQFTGINSIIMYGVSLLSDLLAANSALLNIFVSLLNVIVTASAAPLVEKLGRKTCLLASITGMGTTSVLLAIGIMQSIPILSAVAVIIFVSSFGLGLGPIPFILPSEFVDANAVGATQSWALAANWIATFIVAQFFPILNEWMGKGEVYFIFAAMALFFWLFVAWYVPESKGKADADEVWGRKKERRP